MPVYEAPDHLLGRGTPLRLDRVVPDDIARRLRRETGKPLKIAADRYLVNVNSLRTTGRITEESAALLDDVLGIPVQTRADPDFREGHRSLRLHMSVERSPAVRRAAIALQGTDLQGLRLRLPLGLRPRWRGLHRSSPPVSAWKAPNGGCRRPGEGRDRPVRKLPPHDPSTRAAANAG